MQKGGFDGIENKGINIWKIIFSVVLMQILGIFVSKLDVSLVNKFALKLDMILIIIFGVLLILLNRNKNKRIKNIIITIIILLNLGNIIYNAVYSMKIIREETSRIDQQGYVLTIDEYKDLDKYLENYDTSLYRNEKDLTLTPNDGLSFGYNGVRIFWISLFKATCSVFEKYRNETTSCIYRI